VIGVGNEWRRDDGVGWAVARAVEQRCIGVEVVLTDGEATRLLDAWDGADLAVVVDAVRTGADVGHLHLLSADQVLAGTTLDRPMGGSHALGLAAAVRLGEALDRRPGRLLLIGVEAGDLGAGHGLSAPVAAAVAAAEDAACAAVTGSRAAPA
jgi:hydrogenase maturation protease